MLRDLIYETGGEQPSIWAGMNNEQIKGDDIYAKIPFFGKPLKYVSTATYPNQSTAPIRNAMITNGSLEKLLSARNLQAQTPVLNEPNAPVYLQDSSFDLGTFISENKWLVIGGVVVGGYLLLSMSGGGGLLEQTIVRRYNKK